MVSEKKLIANRNNAKKSQGPRTVQGKARASRNALRHGLAAITLRDPTVPAEVEQLVKAISGDSATALQQEQALIVAESQIRLLKMRAVRIAAIERMRAAVPKSESERGMAGLMALIIRAVTPMHTFAQRRNDQPARPEDDCEAICLALPDLQKLERYDRRASSRRRRAIRRLLELRTQD